MGGRKYLRLFRHAAGATPADLAFPSAPLPYPEGWFCLGFGHEVGPGRVVTRRLTGEDVVLARGASGTLRALRPHCPHLGAHLGVLGTVSGERITCGFHRFEFSLDGPCLRTPYGQPPPRAALGTLPVRESAGLILVWSGRGGSPPSWEPPAIPAAGWLRPRGRTFEVAGHPQQMTENVIDFGHLEQLHGATLAKAPEVSFDGVLCTGRFQVERKLPRVGPVRVDYAFSVHGLGLTIIDCDLPWAGTTARFFALPTPVDPWLSRFRFAATARTGPMGTLATRLLRDALYTVHAAGSTLDLPVWQYQKYQRTPRLAPGDGPIGRYRKWAEQFYPTAAADRFETDLDHRADHQRNS
ncbi:Rieske 2Fe-2S domain-containing protein [Streptomyces sp. FH025]|uniref:Rieske 2Fe-2S domain-containing protein n=1 Tax=Streptomyces sp. FH025 TaxID=2815937 RepID=UPI001A9F50BF|nr:Rieske 2Fe-2S domain-containing protein [Streptomyces sp. FH025]MBO1413385.1 Rieske (2Fe-2S) protein [Streptomyces sp. FH025]